MRISIIAVGRARKGPERELFESFKARITWPVKLLEVEESRPLPAADRVRREGELLLSKLPKGAVAIALDGRGKTLTSEDFAARLGRWQDDGIKDIAFLIGGADGLHGAVTDSAGLTLSLGPMTWPHLLVRGMLAEQIYRAEQILKGHPYHRAGPPPAGNP
jgi:23S rRNA (pseudouridine1915-N3)-methyltransferase